MHSTHLYSFVLTRSHAFPRSTEICAHCLGCVLWRLYANACVCKLFGDISAVCGGEIYNDEGRLSSPNYPDYYKPDKECLWKVTVAEGYSVALHFHSFEVRKLVHIKWSPQGPGFAF